MYRSFILVALQYILYCTIIPMFLCSSMTVGAQDQIKSFVHPSPTVTALAKYGDIPVSYYTGTPGISIPLHEIRTSDYSLPVSLSYHASGIKVEEIASWVGLGWSLNAGGIVARSVRGLPDEGGYMNPSYTVAQLRAMPLAERQEVLMYAVNGHAPLDTEPDMFTFNFNGQSGKFYYDQELQDFITLPRKAIRIDKQHFVSTGKWKITTDDGTEYYFDLAEQNAQSTQCGGGSGGAAPFITTGWFLTMIITPVRRDTILFNYTASNYTINNLASYTLYGGGIGGDLPHCFSSAEQRCDSQNEYLGYRLESITYGLNKIKFLSPTNRADLIGDKKLDRIEVYNNGEVTIPYKKFNLLHTYFNQGSGVVEELRLKLDAVEEVDRDGNKLLPYKFLYNENPVKLPNRLSYAQDSWGYYNGKTTNRHLVPVVNDVLGSYDGSDRRTNVNFLQAGILKRIIYPSQGYTDFDYTSHAVSEKVPYSDPINQRVQKGAFVDLRHGPEGSTVFESPPFEIKGDAQQILYGEYKTGAYADFHVVHATNCNVAGEAQACSVLQLESAGYSIHLTQNMNHHFVPNGIYKLTASFTYNNNPEAWIEFVAQMFWTEPAPAAPVPPPAQEYFVGGLRISKITNNDGYGNVMQKTFSYIDEAFGMSSGDLVTANPVYEYTLECNYYGNNPGFVEGLYRARTGFSNYGLGMTQGSHVGYGQVTVTEDGDGASGKTKYYYFSPADYPDDDSKASQYPFPPAISFDHHRGLLKEMEIYEKLPGGGYNAIKRIQHEYGPGHHYDGLGSTTLARVTRGIKAARNGTTVNRATPAIAVGYELITEWVRPVRTIETDLSSGTKLTKTTTYRYSNLEHLLPTSVEVTTSTGDSRVAYSRYASDIINNAGSTLSVPAQALQDLKQRHRLTTLVEKIETKKSGAAENVTAATVITFNPVSLLPDLVYTFEGMGEKSITEYNHAHIGASGLFHKDGDNKLRYQVSRYDAKGNVLEQNMADNIPVSYLWGHDATYPIAEISNAGYTSIFHTSFEEETSSFSNDAKTGRKSRNTSYTVQLPHAGEFALSYWHKPASGGSWALEVTTVTQAQTIGGEGMLIDEVRLHPKDAMMKTFTYDPGVGITSETDHNSISIHYEYDGYGRLACIRNDEKKIVKAFQYNLAKD